jgi:diaminopimelate decarboxylase
VCVCAQVKDAFEAFAAETGRKLHLEIEPGTFLLANSGAVLSVVQDMVTTGEQGHTFLKMDTGMTELLRPSLYGSQHPLVGSTMPALPLHTTRMEVLGAAE